MIDRKIDIHCSHTKKARRSEPVQVRGVGGLAV
jgi:hypothetical protein